MSAFKFDTRSLLSTKTQSHWICSEVCNTSQLADKLFSFFSFTLVDLNRVVQYNLAFLLCFKRVPSSNTQLQLVTLASATKCFLHYYQQLHLPCKILGRSFESVALTTRPQCLIRWECKSHHSHPAAFWLGRRPQATSGRNAVLDFL